MLQRSCHRIVKLSMLSTGELWYTFGGYLGASKVNWQNLNAHFTDSPIRGV